MPPFNALWTMKSDRLSVEEVADLLGVSPSTIRRRKAAGLMPRCKRLGHLLYYTRDDILAWLPISGFAQVTTDLAASRLKVRV